MLGPLSLGLMVTPITGGVLGGLQDGEIPAAIARIPAGMLRLYVDAASECRGLSWTVLAAIGAVESDNGESRAAGVHAGANYAGAEGPMQFEPATFAAYARPVPPGGAVPPSPYDAVDSVYAAARMLCHDGAGSVSGLRQAIWDYNHSGQYVDQVLAQARTYGLGGSAPSRVGRIALDYALAQVGTPYRWGGEAAGVGFDCSGLAQAAYRAAGVSLPRVAQAQFDAGPFVPAGALRPGDLVFFGPVPGVATHVGLVVDPAGVMVDAPHTGTAVRVEGFAPTVGARWGGDIFVGATDPGP